MVLCVTSHTANGPIGLFRCVESVGKYRLKVEVAFQIQKVRGIRRAAARRSTPAVRGKAGTCADLQAATPLAKLQIAHV
ncbi:unnamed protein product, partial [Iphiclides podalirius]